MAVFSERHAGYRGGAVLFCIGVVLFIVGFASPYWTTSTSQETFGSSVDTHTGLWEACYKSGSGSSVCFSTTKDTAESASWYKAVQAMQCLALIGFLLAVCYGVNVNWCSKSRVFNRYLECAIGFSAALGLIGAIVYAAEQEKAKKRLDDIDDDFGYDRGVDFQPVAWSFIVDVIGCILTIVAAILITVFNKPLPDVTPPTTFQPMPPATTVVPGTTYAYTNPAAAPYIIAYTANPQPAYIQGQPMAVHNGMNPPTPNTMGNAMNPPSYDELQMKGQSPLGVAGGPSTGGTGHP